MPLPLPPGGRRAHRWTLAAVVVALLAGAGVVALRSTLAAHAGTARAAAAARSDASTPPASRAPRRPTTAGFRRRVVAQVTAAVSPALRHAAIPARLSPRIAQAPNDRYPDQGCVAPYGPATSEPICFLGDRHAARRLVLFGDSHAHTWLSAVLRFGRQHGWTVIPVIHHACEPFRFLNPGTCRTWFRWAVGQVRRLHPDAIVVGHYWTGWGRISIGAVGRELRTLRPLTHRLVLIQDIPSRPETTVACLDAPRATLGSCVFPIAPSERAIYPAVARQAAAAGATYLKILPFICHDGRCPTVVGRLISYRNREHLTQTYARFLAPLIATRLAAALR